MALDFPVRWSDNTKELTAHLKEGLGVIETTRAAADKMAATLGGDRLLRAGNTFAAALQQIGGAEKLTNAERERGLALLDKTIAKYQALGQTAPPALRDIANQLKSLNAESATGGLGSALEGLGKQIATTAAGFVSAQAILGAVSGAWNTLTGFVEGSIKAAGDAEKAHVQLVAALRAQGTAIPSVIAAYQGYATALQRTTVFSDDAIEASQALLVQVGNVMPRDMEKALVAVTNLASGLGKDLTEATLLVAKAAEGNVTALKKAGVVIDETKAKAGGFGVVLDAINEKFGGQAAALAGTYEGRLKQLGNTWNNVEESIGRVITQNATVLRAFELINSAIDSQTGELKDNATVTNLVSDAVILAARGVVLFAQALDAAQTVSAAFVISMRDGAIALGNIGIFAFQAAKGIAFLAGNMAAVEGANIGIKALQGAVRELKDRNDVTTKSSADFGTALQVIAGKADALAKDLETTRGHIVALKDVTDGGADAWKRHTLAVNADAEAMKKWEAANKNISAIPVGSVADGLNPVAVAFGKTLASIDGSVVEAVKFYLQLGVSQQELATWYKLTDTQIHAVDESLKIDAELAKIAAGGHRNLADALEEVGKMGLKGEAGLDAIVKTMTEMRKIEKEFMTGFIKPGEVGGTIIDPKDDLKAIEERAKLVDDGFKALQETLQHIGQIAGGTFGIILSGLADMIPLIRAVHEANLKADLFPTDANIQAAAATRTKAIYAGIGIAAASVAQATSGSTSRGGEIVNSTAQGVAVGTSVAPFLGPYGGLAIGVGAAAGALVGVIKSMKEWHKVADDVAKSYAGIKIDKDLGEQIAKIEKSTGLQRAQAELTQLDQIISQGGGLNKDNIDILTQRLRDGFSFLARGEITAIQMTQILDKNFQAFATAGTDKIGLLNKGIVELIRLDRQAGTESAAISSYVTAQLTSAADGLQQFLKAGMIGTQATADALQAALGAMFTELQNRLVSIVEVFKILGPAMDALRRALAAGGFAESPIFAQLEGLRTLAQEIAPALNAVAGLGQLLAGLANTGLLTQDMFTGLADQITATFNKLVAQGKNGNDVLLLMQPQLQLLWELEQKFGFSVDAATQALLDQAKQQHLVGDEFRSPQEQMIELEKLQLQVLAAMARMFGVTLPEAVQAYIDSLNKIPTSIPQYPTPPPPGPGVPNYPIPTIPPGLPPRPPPDQYPPDAPWPPTGPIPAAVGVTPFGMAGFTSNVLPFVPRASATGSTLSSSSTTSTATGTMAPQAIVVPIYLDGHVLTTAIVNDVNSGGRNATKFKAAAK